CLYSGSHIKANHVTVMTWCCKSDRVCTIISFRTAERNNHRIGLTYGETNKIMFSSFLSKVGKCATMTHLFYTDNGYTVFFSHFDCLIHCQISSYMTSAIVSVKNSGTWSGFFYVKCRFMIDTA